MDFPLPEPPKRSPKLDDPHEVSVVAGIFGMNPSQVYQMRKSGQLPQEANASYRKVLSAGIAYWKNKAAGRDNDAETLSRIQKTKLDAARTEETWLRVLEKRGDQTDPALFLDLLEPSFILLRDTLMQVGHDHPETKPSITAALKELALHGRKLEEAANSGIQNRLEAKLNEAREEAEEIAADLEAARE